MDTENVVHLHNGIIYSIIKNNEFMKFLGKWMELENIILSDVTQSQKLQITRIQSTDHMKLKKKEDQSVDTLVLLRRRTKYSQKQVWR
jgi:23S rRNA pseudoU1915 N3-methylase RlmH